MNQDWDTTDELKKDIITAVYQDINNKIDEMVENVDSPRSLQKGY